MAIHSLALFEMRIRNALPRFVSLNFNGRLTGDFRFPQFYPVSFWVGNPGEATVVVVLNFLDGDAVTAELSEHAVEVGDAVVDHEGGSARAEVFRVRRKKRPSGAAFFGGAFSIMPEKIGVAVFNRNAEVFAIPGRHFFEVCGAEKDAA